MSRVRTSSPAPVLKALYRRVHRTNLRRVARCVGRRGRRVLRKEASGCREGTSTRWAPILRMVSTRFRHQLGVQSESKQKSTRKSGVAKLERSTRKVDAARTLAASLPRLAGRTKTPGEVAEWFMALAWKASGGNATQVQILSSPPINATAAGSADFLRKSGAAASQPLNCTWQLLALCV